MSSFQKRAAQLRADTSVHTNCAQAVVVPFAEAAGITEETARRFAANFGGGMKRASVCGAVTGGLMVLGLFGLDDPKAIAEFYARLKANHDGVLDCAELLRRHFQQGGEKKPHCDAMVLEGVGLAEELLRKYGKLPDPAAE